MKTFLFGLVFSALCLCLSAQPVRAQDDESGDTSFQTFYDQLGNEGTWIQTDDYGYVFQPAVSDPNWSPYTVGHWAYNPDVGWIWVSQEPWGWATYHYGRWTNLDGVGWCWVPGYHWAPAWVSWRYGGGYCGWAPLPPDTSIGVDFRDRGYGGYGSGGYGGGGGGYGGGGYGDGGRVDAQFHFGGDVDVAFHIGAGAYNFVPVGALGDPGLRRRIINRNNNFGVINRTTNITNITNNTTNRVTNNYITNNNQTVTNNRFAGIRAGGPPINEVNAASRTPVPTVQLTTSRQAGVASQRGNMLALYAPRVQATGTTTAARPTRVAGKVGHTAVNRGENIQHPLIAYRGAPALAPTAAQVHQAHVAQVHAPAQAQLAPTLRPAGAPENQREFSSPPTASNHAVSPEAPYHPSEPTAVNHPAAMPSNSEQTLSSGEERARARAERIAKMHQSPAVMQTESPGTQHAEVSHAGGGEAYHPAAMVSHAGSGEAYHPAATVSHPGSGEAYHPAATVSHPGSGEAYHPAASVSHPAAQPHPQSGAPAKPHVVAAKPGEAHPAAKPGQNPPPNH